MHCLKIKHVHLSSVPISLFIPSNLSSLLHLCLAPSWLSSTQLTCFIFLSHHERLRLKFLLLRRKSSCLSRFTGPSPSSFSADVVMLGFKPSHSVHPRRLCLVTEDIEQYWRFLMFCNTSPPTFRYSQGGSNIFKCTNSFTNRLQTFRFYISNPLKTPRIVLGVLDVFNLHLMCPQSNDGVVTVARRKDTDTAARREDANTTARREDAGTATFWCGGDAATPFPNHGAGEQLPVPFFSVAHILIQPIENKIMFVIGSYIMYHDDEAIGRDSDSQSKRRNPFSQPLIWIWVFKEEAVVDLSSAYHTSYVTDLYCAEIRTSFDAHRGQ
ncbi:hypothetical protein YC2023_093472 [Brassica napus]